MAVKAVIFDLDGTITEPFFDFDSIREEMGLDRNAGPVWEIMQQATDAERARLDGILRYHEQLGIDNSTLQPGAKETLQWIRSQSLPIAVLTRNTKDNAIKVAHKHNVEFDIFIGREDGPVKPDAFGVKFICEKFDVAPNEAIMVGDYLFDLLCAKAAGAKSVLLLNNEKAREFAEYADYMIEKMSLLVDIIQIENSKNES